MLSKALVFCSPVDTRTSYSRGGGFPSATSRASFTRAFVSPAMAETTTATSLPESTVATTRRATFLMRSTSPTLVPPNFCTIRATFRFLDPSRRTRELDALGVRKLSLPARQNRLGHRSAGRGLDLPLLRRAGSRGIRARDPNLESLGG